MKVLVVSGFLGAGKTTFIRELLARGGHDFAVLENEFGEADVDTTVLTTDNDASDLRVWELTEGCVCCSMKADFAATILTIENAVNPEILIVEPTGIARLSSIMANLQRIAYDRITFLPPVTIVDWHHLENRRDAWRDIYEDQIAAASRIVLSKTGGLVPGMLEDIVDHVQTLAPDADIVARPYADIDNAWFERLLSDDRDAPTTTGGTISSIGPAPEMDTFSLHDVRLPSPDHLVLFLNGLAAACFGRIVRAKGFLPCGGAWLHFELVNGLYSVTGIAPQPEATAVFIGTGLDRQALRLASATHLFRDDPARELARAV